MTHSERKREIHENLDRIADSWTTYKDNERIHAELYDYAVATNQCWPSEFAQVLSERLDPAFPKIIRADAVVLIGNLGIAECRDELVRTRNLPADDPDPKRKYIEAETDRALENFDHFLEHFRDRSAPPLLDGTDAIAEICFYSKSHGGWRDSPITWPDHVGFFKAIVPLEDDLTFVRFRRDDARVWELDQPRTARVRLYSRHIVLEKIHFDEELPLFEGQRRLGSMKLVEALPVTLYNGVRASY